MKTRMYNDGTGDGLREFRNTPNVHRSSTRLFVNAGINFPACQANAPLLDMDKANWELTTIKDRITCKHCLKLMARGLT